MSILFSNLSAFLTSVNLSSVEMNSAKMSSVARDNPHAPLQSAYLPPHQVEPPVQI